MSTSGLNVRPFNGNVRMHADPRSVGGVRLPYKDSDQQLGQESTSFLNGSKPLSNGGGRLAMSNANYQQSYPIQYPDVGPNRKMSCEDTSSMQPKPTCTTFRQPTARKSGVIRIDARDYSNDDNDTSSTVMTLPRAMNPMSNYSGTTTTAIPKQQGKSVYVQRNASKTSLYAPASISHTIAMTTPPAMRTTNARSDLPAPPAYAESTNNGSIRRQISSNSFGTQGAHEYTTGTMRRSKPTTSARDEAVLQYPSSFADTLQYTMDGKDCNSIPAPVKDSAQHVAVGQAQLEKDSNNKKDGKLTISESRNLKADDGKRDVARHQHPEKKANVIVKDRKSDFDKMNRKTLCCVIFALFILLFAAVVTLIYFASNYTTAKEASGVDKGKVSSRVAAAPSSKPTRAKSTFFPTPEVTKPTVRRTRITVKQPTRPTKDQSRKFCMSPNCVKAAGAVLKKMNKTADPCEDFYEYACGGWLSNNFMPPDKINYGVVSKIASANERLLYEALIRTEKHVDLSSDLRGYVGENVTEAEIKAKMFFRSCLDVSFINQMGAVPMQEMVAGMGGWYALGNWEEKNWDLDRLLYILQGEQSISVFFAMSIQPTNSNETRNILRLDADGVTIPDTDFYVNDMTSSGIQSVVTAYKRLIRTILKLLGARDIENVVSDVYNFEKQLATTIAQATPEDTILTIGELRKLCPQISWYLLLQHIITKQTLNYNSEVIVSSRTYMENLATLMRNTSTRTLHNYMMWRTVVSKASYLSTPFRKAMSEFSSVLHGSMPELPVWQQCMIKAEEHFGIAVGATFVRQGFSKQNKQKVERMAQNIKDSFRSNLGNMKWMDESTTRTAIEKLKSMAIAVGYPDELLSDPARLNQEYDFQVDESTYFKNILNSIKFKITQRVDTLLSSKDNSPWALSPQTMNAFYSPVINQVFFPAGLLQTPLFDATFPTAFNYGGIGSMIGHEITHGYDALGQGYDANGSFDPWWTAKTASNYQNNSQCLASYYSKYSIGDLFVNGKVTLTENIADIAGLKVSFMAYRKWKSMPRNSKAWKIQLPGLGLNDEQLFFVGYAQTWCMKRLPASYRIQFLQDHHAPEKFRVLGGVSQNQEFAKAFNCAPQSTMNPDERCSVW